jgi:pimeloyl-ACP methyl ester carboxylesterase
MKSSQQPSFVFVHGGGHGSWCWAQVQRHLKRPSLAVDLPGRTGSEEWRSALRIEDLARAVVRDVDVAELGPVVLVGHSIGGVTVAAVAEILGTRVQRCIFVSSPMPAEGERIVDTINPILRWFCMRAIRHGCRDLTLPPPVARLIFCNDMSTANRRLMLDRMTPEAMGVVVERVHYGPVMQRVPKTFIKLGRDRAVRPPRQDTAIANLGSGIEVLHLHTGHDAMLSRPAELAAVIESAC